MPSARDSTLLISFEHFDVISIVDILKVFRPWKMCIGFLNVLTQSADAHAH